MEDATETNVEGDSQDKVDGFAHDGQVSGAPVSDSDREQLLRTSFDVTQVSTANGKGKTTLFSIRQPTKGKRLSETDDEEPSSESLHMPKSPTKAGKKFSRKSDHVTFEDIPQPKSFEFVPQKATKFGIGTSSSDHNFRILPDDDSDDDDNIENIDITHTADMEHYAVTFEVPSKVRDTTTKSEQEKQDSSGLFSPGKSESLNRSFIKGKLSSPLRKRNGCSENKTERSPLLGKASSRSSPVNSIDSAILRAACNDDGGESNQRDLKSELEESSEEDSPFTNTSEDADNVLSPSIISDGKFIL